MVLPKGILDRILRRKVALHRTPLDRYQVRLARTLEEYEQAFRLVHFAYVYQGIENIRAPELRLTPQHFLPEAFVLVAFEGDILVGTMTVTLDSPAGLPLDKDYPIELGAMRQRGARLVEYGSYAIVERCWSSGVSNLLYLAANTLTSCVLEASHVVVGVNPKVVPFYSGVFNFELLGAAKPHATLDAPVAGLVQDVSRLEAFLTRSYAKPMATGKPPVAHFFGEPLACIELPRGHSTAELARCRMSRGVLQTLLRERADLVETLDAPTRRHLENSRSRTTLTLPENTPKVLSRELTFLRRSDEERAAC